jgi:hypothetical protein
VGRFVALAGAVLALVVIIANALGRWQRLRMIKLIVRDRNPADQAEQLPDDRTDRPGPERPRTGREASGRLS